MPSVAMADFSLNLSSEEPWTISTLESLTFTVEVREDGSPASGQSVTFSVSPDDGIASLSTTSATTDSNGQAQTTLSLSGDSSESSYTVTAQLANGEGNVPSETVPVGTVSDGAELILYVDLRPYSPGESVAFTFSLRKDGSGGSSRTVTFSVSPDDGTASLSTTSATIHVNGSVGTKLILGSNASGRYTVTATLDDGKSVSNGIGVVHNSNKPSGFIFRMLVRSGALPLNPGGSRTFIAIVEKNGYVSGRTVTFSVSPNDGTVSLSTTTATTDSNGEASTTLTTGSGSSGTYTVTATLDNGQSISGTSTVKAPPPSSPEVILIAISASNSNFEPGDTVTFTVEVKKDRDPVPDRSVIFSVSPDDRTASLSATSATTDSNGEAQTTLNLGTDASGSYTVTASVGTTSTSTIVKVEMPTVSQQQQQNTDPNTDAQQNTGTQQNTAQQPVNPPAQQLPTQPPAQQPDDASNGDTEPIVEGTQNEGDTQEEEDTTQENIQPPGQQQNTDPNTGTQQTASTQQNTVQQPVNPPAQQPPTQPPAQQPDDASNGDTEPIVEDTQNEGDTQEEEGTTQENIQPPGQPPTNNQGSGGGGGTLPKPVTPINPTVEPFDYEREGVGKIVFSEWMLSTLNDMPQWIELYNTTDEDIDLQGWQIVGRFMDGNDNIRKFKPRTIRALTVKAKQSHLIVADLASVYRGAFSENLQDNVYSLRSTHQLWYGKGIVLELQDSSGTPIDRIGNLNEQDQLEWEIPSRTRHWGNSERRISLIRRLKSVESRKYNFRFGVAAFGWFPADEVEKLTEVKRSAYFYGRPSDIGTPGYRTEGADPLPVTLSYFLPQVSENNSVVLSWTTASEIENAGFNVLRSEDEHGAFVKVNVNLIQGAGTTSDRNEYTWIDTTARPNVEYYYRIEDVSFDGISEVVATQRLKGIFTAKNRALTRWAILKKGAE